MKFQLFLATLFTSTLTACGGAAPSPESPNHPNDPTDPTDPADPADPSAPAISLAGAWAMQVTTGQILSSPLGDGPASVVMLSLVRATESGTALSMTGEICRIEMSEFQGATTTYPATTLNAMSGAIADAQVSKLAAGGTFTVPEHPHLLGWRAQNDEMTEALPDEEDDARVEDVDGDGHPGATIAVESAFASGDVYIVNRTIRSYSGKIISADKIEGRSTTDMEQAIVGASEVLLTFGDVTSRPDPDPSTNTFTMIRLPQNADCSSVEAAF